MINGERLAVPPKYLVDADTTAIIDVTAAVAAARQFKNTETKQRQVLESVRGAAAGSIGYLEKVNKFATDPYACLGGNQGIPIPHGGDIAALSNEVIKNLATIRAAIDGAL